MRIGIIGMGQIGRASALVLSESSFCSRLGIADISPISLELPFHTYLKSVLDVSDEVATCDFIKMHDAIVSALPYNLNLRVAAACAATQVSFFCLTEDNTSVDRIREMARDSSVCFVPQCGLAPGVVNIVAAHLIRKLGRATKVDLRVGALPASVNNGIKYHTSWSAAGLINQYTQPSEVIFNGARSRALPLEGLESIVIAGNEYEAFHTSGGIGTMCETFHDVVEYMDYKTIRYRGHHNIMRSLLFDFDLISNADLLTGLVERAIAKTEDDIVIMHVAATSEVLKGRACTQVTKMIRPMKVGGEILTAIQCSTAAGVVGVLELFSQGLLRPGFVKQEDILFEQFLKTQWGNIFKSS